MYCKYCGEEISEDSKFCKYCGKDIIETNEATSKVIPSQEDASLKSEEILSIQKNNPLKIEIAQKQVIQKSTIANEVVANLKMIGWALLIWCVFIIGFVVYHQKDISKVPDNSYWGESCYDSKIMSSIWEFNWEKQYAISIEYLIYVQHNGFNNFKIFNTYFISNSSNEQCLKSADEKAMELELSDESITQIKNEAKQKAKADKESFNDEINNLRKWKYNDDLKNNMLWAAIIAIFVTNIGRYFLKFGKWIVNNKTGE
jgi:zinc-ribbon domain